MDAVVEEGQFIATTSSHNILRVCSRNSRLPGVSTAGVSPINGWDNDDECWCEEESGLMSIGDLCGGGKLGMIVISGGSIVSSLLVPGNSSCISLATTC